MKKVLFVIVIVLTCGLYTLPVSANRAIKNSAGVSKGIVNTGTYRALIIAINDYKDPAIPDLKTPLNDAKQLNSILKNQYGFKTELLVGKKASRSGIYNKLREFSSSAEKGDSLLIYYAGHGERDRVFNDGWWIPYDAKGGAADTYLDNTIVQKAMKSTAARHVLLVSDSCYSGALFGSSRAIPPVINDKYYKNMFSEKSRWGMTSGNKEPVSDDGIDGHSIFAYQFIKALKKNEKPYFSAQEIYTNIAPIIGNNSEQTPLCRPVKNTGDQGGQFIFLLASAGAYIGSPETDKSPQNTNNAITDSEIQWFEANINELLRKANRKKTKNKIYFVGTSFSETGSETELYKNGLTNVRVSISKILNSQSKRMNKSTTSEDNSKELVIVYRNTSKLVNDVVIEEILYSDSKRYAVVLAHTNGVKSDQESTTSKYYSEKSDDNKEYNKLKYNIYFNSDDKEHDLLNYKNDNKHKVQFAEKYYRKNNSNINNDCLINAPDWVLTENKLISEMTENVSLNYGLDLTGAFFMAIDNSISSMAIVVDNRVKQMLKNFKETNLDEPININNNLSKKVFSATISYLIPNEIWVSPCRDMYMKSKISIED